MQARVFVFAITAAVAGFTACASEPVPATPADYVAALERICADTTATFEALPEPPEQIAVADFASRAADALDNEAERARALAVPAALADDHRAFVLNTDDQAATWRSIATEIDSLDVATVRIGELVRGRNDLVDDMGAAQCRRGDV